MKTLDLDKFTHAKKVNVGPIPTTEQYIAMLMYSQRVCSKIIISRDVSVALYNLYIRLGFSFPYRRERQSP